jgi:hypothetical protein
MPDTVNIDALVRAGLVPYIATWSGERPIRTPVVAEGSGGIGYRRERQGDRDAHGVLWVRITRAFGEGEPQFSKVHPYRQRHAMRHLFCQICSGPADQNEHGVLWLLGGAEQDWSGKEMTSQPPVCLRCAGPASRACPHLRQGTLALRVRHAPLAGVFGELYTPTRRGPVGVGDYTLTYDNPQVIWMHAYQLVRKFHDWTVVDLDQELARNPAEY